MESFPEEFTSSVVKRALEVEFGFNFTSMPNNVKARISNIYTEQLVRNSYGELKDKISALLCNERGEERISEFPYDPLGWTEISKVGIFLYRLLLSRKIDYVVLSKNLVRLSEVARDIYLLPYLEDRLEFENRLGGYRDIIRMWNSKHRDVCLSLSAGYTVGIEKDMYNGYYAKLVNYVMKYP